MSKLAVTGVLVVLTFVDLGWAIGQKNEPYIFPVDFYTPVIKIVTFVSFAGLG